MTILPASLRYAFRRWRHRPALAIAAIGATLVPAWRLAAFGTTLIFLASVRPAMAGPSAPTAGGIVRVTALDGTRRTGELVSLTTTEIVIRQDGQPITIPLSTVATVERRGRAKLWGALIGGAAGAVYGYGVFEESTSDPNFELKGALIVGSLGAAGGFGLGAMIDRAHRSGNTLYKRPGKSVTLSVAPIVGRSAHGIGAIVRW